MASNRVFATLGLIAAVAVATPAAVLAAGTLDQQVTGANDGFAVYGTLIPAQVFTAGFTGELDQIDLHLTTGFGPPPPGGADAPADDLTVQLWTVADGVPDSPIAGASATVLRAAVPRGTSTWVHVPFSAASVAGTQYAIVLSSPDSSGGDCPDVCWSWRADENNPYADGGSFYRQNSPDWVAQARDFNFKTYVTRHTDLQVYLAGNGEGANGEVKSIPARIDCGSACLATFVSDTTVILVAHPFSTATFGYWEGGPCDGSTQVVCEFTMPTELVETTAVFYGIEATPVPTSTPTASKPAVTVRPTASSAPGVSVAPTLAPSDVPASPVESGLVTALPTLAVTLAPGETPGPTAAPIEPAAASGGPPIILLLLAVVAALVAGGAGLLYVLRRRTRASTS